MKGTIMLFNTKGQIVSVPAGFHKESREKQEVFLTPLREFHEPRSHKGAHGFNIEARAHLK